jgi:hypothetical protein
MQSAENASLRTRVIVLHEPGIDAEIAKGALVVAFEKESALVGEDLRLDDFYGSQFCLK